MNLARIDQPRINQTTINQPTISQPGISPAGAEPLRQVISEEQIQKRVKELARNICSDYRGQTVQVLAVLENAFIFVADLVRAMDVPTVCQFIKPKYNRQTAGDVMEIFFGHPAEIRGQHS
jgi:hypoxanthine phosphoribosyltransferase